MDTRPLAPHDRPHLEAALRSDGTFRDDEVAVALELIDASLAGDPSYRVRVAVADDRVVGYICFGATPMTDGTWDLYWIVTHAEARGRGVAGALIGAMETEIRPLGATAIRVETSQLESYGAARRVYERHGYPEVARFTDFYRAGDDLVVFYKRL
jgi:ribosomal protein S18 acetylase RimI-like enzyme